MKKQIRKIVLQKETLRNLVAERIADPRLAEVAGGSILPRTNFNSCRCPTVSCKPGFC